MNRSLPIALVWFALIGGQASAESKPLNLQSAKAARPVGRPVPLDRAELPERCVLLFGQEGPGLSPEAVAAASGIIEITQYGSTRSINASAAGAVVMYEWCRRWA